MENYIVKCVNYHEKHTQELTSFLSEINVSKEKDTEKPVLVGNLIFKYFEYGRNVSSDLHRSVLSGENYFSNLNTELEKLKALVLTTQETFDKCASELDNPKDYQDLKVKADIFNQLVSNINNYQFLCWSVNDDLRHQDNVNAIYITTVAPPNENTLNAVEELVLKLRNAAETISESSLKGEKDNTGLINTDFLLFEVSIYLAQLDYDFQCSKEYLNNLIWFKVELEKAVRKYEDSPDVLDILFSKCNFLIKKILKRRGDGKVIIDDEELLIDKLNQSINHYKSFDTLNNERYKKNSTIYWLNSELALQCHGELDANQIKYVNVHFLAKYYNKRSKEEGDKYLEKNDELINYINRKPIEDINEVKAYNEWAKQSMIIFLEKNKLKILLNNLSLKIKDVTKLREEEIDGWVDAIHQQVNKIDLTPKAKINDDYYQYKITIKTFIVLINLIFTNRKAFEWKKLLRKINKLNDDFVKQYERRLDVAESNNLTPFYLPFNECIDVFKDSKDSTGKTEEWRLFLDSAYLLPINFEHEKKESLDIQSDYLNAKTKSDIVLNYLIDDIESRTQETVASFKKDINDNLESKIKESNNHIEIKNENLVRDVNRITDEHTMRGVQVLGIFAGIMSFAFSSVNTIPKFRCGEGIILFLIALGTILGGFVWIINYLVITREKEERKFEADLITTPSKYARFYMSKRTWSGIAIIVTLLFCAWLSKDLKDCGLNNDDGKDGLHNSINFQPNNNQTQQIIDSCNNYPQIKYIYIKPKPLNCCDSLEMLKKQLK